MLGAEFGVSSESFLKHNPEGGAESSKPIDIVVYSETQFGTLSYGDVAILLINWFQMLGMAPI
jgi:hypothetical protein